VTTSTQSPEKALAAAAAHVEDGPGGLHGKLARLRCDLRRLLSEGLIIAFSGGVDSAFLAWVAEHERRAAGGRLLALTARSESLARRERSDVDDFVRVLGVNHVWQDSREMDDPQYVRNDPLRCYHCKKELFRLTAEQLRREGYAHVAYGYNASDGADIRPGHRAARENAVVSPLADAGLSKEEIRALMRELGVPMAEKPAGPCLSSRLMTGVAVTAGKLRDVEEMEELLGSAGVRVARVRLHEESGRRYLRIEVPAAEMASVAAIAAQLSGEGRKRGYERVLLDLAGYRMGGGNA
jgi:pyridinium-3,5-biscarboxylic acid mononucleotide sulfurtransferase